ncbi:MAG: hypothetical protein M3374_04765 [Pseudomonadota bacterium]|nr:hypothetical protein [Pseudomonadota bacterium]
MTHTIHAPIFSQGDCVIAPHKTLLLAAALVAAMSLAPTASAATNALTAGAVNDASLTDTVKRSQDMQAAGVPVESTGAALNADGSVSSGMTAVLQE